MPPVQRFKLTISYRGSHYHGWQAQPMPPTWKGTTPEPGTGIPTVQEAVARALVQVVKHPVSIVGSSRTDTGVHAKAQVAHFDTDKTQIPIEGMRQAINARLPDDILVRAIEPVPRVFDSIRSTISKRYQYFIWNAPDRPPFFSDLVWHRWKVLDLDAMRDAAGRLTGTHDFTSFCRPGHGRETTIRTVHKLDIHLRSPRLVIGVQGSGFLWHMVRIMVGTLVEVGIGRYRPEEIDAMLAACDRKAAGLTAPARGLYLQWIRFDPAHLVESSADRCDVSFTQHEIHDPSPDDAIEHHPS